MKIVSAYFENFIGFNEGLGRKKVTINFGKDDPQIILFLGTNGSGKTTMLSALNPYPGCNDKRKSFILEGQKGRKTITYSYNGDTIVVDHHFSPDEKNYSYFSKNGVELNEKGGIRSFEALVEEHLGCTKEFFEVGRMGSNVSSFIDRTASERKKFISNFMPNIEGFLDINSKVNKTINQIKDRIEFISDELSKLPPIKDLQNEAERITRLKDTIQIELDEVNNKISSAEGELLNIKSSNNITSTVNTFKNEYTVASKNLNEVMELTKDITESVEHFEKIIAENQLQKINLEKEHIKIIEQKKAIDNECTRIDNEITTKQLKLKTLKKDQEEVEKLEKLKEETISSISELQNELENIAHPFKQQLLEIPNIENIKEACDLISSAQAIFQSTYSKLNESSINKLIELNKNGRLKDIKSEIIKLQEKQELLDTEIKKLDKKKILADEQLKQRDSATDLLKKRPKACNINSCAFISNSLKYIEMKIDDNILTEIDAEITKVSEQLRAVKAGIVYFNNIADIINHIKITYDGLCKKNLVKRFNLKDYLESETSFIGILEQPMDNLKSIFNIDIEKKIYFTIHNKNQYTKKLNEMELNISKLNPNKNITEEIDAEINSLSIQKFNKSSEKEKNEEIFNSQSMQIKLIEGNLNKFSIILKALKEKETIISNYNEIKTKYENMDKLILEILKKETDILSFKNAKVAKQSQMAEIEKEVKEINVKITRFEEYMTLKNKITENFENLTYISKASSTTTGIPMLLIKDYLEQIKVIVNSLLHIVYKGTFTLHDFTVNEKEFLISIKKPTGFICDDILSISQGESALIKTSLGLAMIKKVLGEYNIISLDEIDGPLDHKIKPLFVDILQNQIADMNIEQLFIISHNDEFFNNKVGLVLFNGHNIKTSDKEFMRNKKIIADFS